MNIAIIQADIQWEKSDLNTSILSSLFKRINNNPEIICLPEMFNTGFSMNTINLAEKMDGKTILWMKEYAASLKNALCGSLIVKEHDNYYNRFVFTEKNGEIITYDKRHLFRMNDEEKHFKKGSKRVIFEYHGWRICPQICYDLRFPVWSRNHNDYDLLIYASNWPGARKAVWSTLLKARAIENLSYVIGVNRVGTDGNGIYYSGNSMVVNPKGEIIAEAGENEEILETQLSLDDLKDFRIKFPAYRDADDFIIK